jgi:ABC-type multidrug transport system ATPase subunit
LSFARALAFDPRILVLDEATASVDTETEILIRDALHVLMAGRTTIAIAHRLSTIQDMDTILVLHKGPLRESGSHQELLAQRVYHRLYQLQHEKRSRNRGPERPRRRRRVREGLRRLRPLKKSAPAGRALPGLSRADGKPLDRLGCWPWGSSQ